MDKQYGNIRVMEEKCKRIAEIFCGVRGLKLLDHILITADDKCVLRFMSVDTETKSSNDNLDTITFTIQDFEFMLEWDEEQLYNGIRNMYPSKIDFSLDGATERVTLVGNTKEWKCK